MNENEIIKTIKSTLGDSSLIGDDCAYLKDYGLFVTQDSLVEGVHFDLGFISAKELGYKAVAVNLSDLAAAAAVPGFITIALSLPQSVSENFVKEFYEGVDEICQKYGVKVAGGDITSANSIFISITAIGKKTSEFNSSLKNAKVGDFVVTSGFSGDSAAGLCLLQKGEKTPERIIKSHISPEPEIEKSLLIAKYTDKNFALTDTSDGLAVALLKIAEESGVTLEIDFEKIPISQELKKNFENYYEYALFGGEDYKLIGTVGESTFSKLPKNSFFAIGKVMEKHEAPIIIQNNEKYSVLTRKYIETQSYKHF